MKTQIAFIGGRKEAAINSIIKFYEKGSNLVAIYSNFSEKVWKEVKKEVKKLFKEIKEEKINDFSDIKKIGKVISKYKEPLLINITGVSKEGAIGLIIFLSIIKSKNVLLKMLQINGKTFEFSPNAFKYFICEKKRRNLKIIEILKENKELSLKELSKKLKRNKATISERIKSLENKGIIIKERKGREVRIRLNTFGEYLYEFKKGGML